MAIDPGIDTIHPEAVGSKASSEANYHAAKTTLAAHPMPADVEQSAKLLDRHYGLSGTVATLSSEVECTEEVTLPDGRRLILKTSIRPQTSSSFRFQAEAISGVEGAAGFVSPQIMRTNGGEVMFEEDGACGYLQTLIDGSPLHKLAMTPDLLFQIGCSLARLDLALDGVRASSSQRPVLLHVECWSRLMEFSQYLPSQHIAEQVRAAMDNYAECVEPHLAEVAWQITHNDPSPHNMLLTDRGIGFIDFGDGCWGPRIQDLAVAASHMVQNATVALGGADYVIAGYHSVIPLSPVEAKILVGLMRARQSALLLVNAWRTHLFPEQAEYINKNVPRAERGLSILTTLSADEAEAAVLAAMALPHPSPV
ncbi:phosphotransferase enzyme family protein [Rhizobium skierniewicense]|uniref:phosphotransferase enzyme family protein n=1 Tax=Rhizobium skierniewicense TaxID=984260 RepID=UPI001FAB73F1|nr:phosphotransferase [Rhizobium skierniewicense]